MKLTGIDAVVLPVDDDYVDKPLSTSDMIAILEIHEQDAQQQYEVQGRYSRILGEVARRKALTFRAAIAALQEQQKREQEENRARRETGLPELKR